MDNPLALIIEDDHDLAFIFTEAVSAAGYEVETFYSGFLAMQRLGEVQPHLVVLDLHLPGIAGPTILKHIRSQEKLKNVRVIVATADHILGSQLRDRITMVLLKPISFVQLSELAQRLRKTAASSPEE